MKKIIIALFIPAIFFLSCNNNKSKDAVTITSKDGNEQVTIDPKQMQNAAQDMEKIKDRLGNLTPLTADQLKALIPEKLMGGERTHWEVTSAMGTSIANADYKINEDTNLKLSVIDCAGTAGAGLYSMQYLGMYNMQHEDEDEYTKTIEFNGGKAFENCKKTRKECTLTYFTGDRFLVTLEGDNVSIDALKQTAKELNIK